MNLVLPNDVRPAAFEAFLASCRRIVGADNVLAEEQDRTAYRDGYAIAGSSTHLPSAAVAPASTEEVQAVVRAANSSKVPLWPVSRGRNLTYGGSAPQLSGSVVLDLSRMKRIVEVDPDLGYAVVEPGVGFFDLYNHLKDKGFPLWMSCPEHGWGSVLGNALDRGIGRTPIGDHSRNLCGIEAVLPDGSLVRTGMGAMTNGRTAHAYQPGFGPHWDQMFVQSGLGVVTRAGVWLMRPPPATTTLSISTDDDGALETMIEIITGLVRRGLIDQYFSLTNVFVVASIIGDRTRWHKGEGPMPEPAIRAMMADLHLGRWMADIVLQGEPTVNAAKEQLITEAFAGHSSITLTKRQWSAGEPQEMSAMSAPDVAALQLANWYGGRGGHMDFSPILPSRPDEVAAHVRRTEQMHAKAGLDYFCAIHIKERHAIAINALVFDRDDVASTDRVRSLFGALIEDAAAHGYGEYRTHLDWMDKVAAAYDFGDGAMMRLNERVKDALDPNGIIAPGKSGIWPARFRQAGASR